MTYHKYDFYKYVAPHVYGIPEPVVEDTVEDVIIDFCQKSSVYRQWLEDTISVDIGDTEVEIDLPRYTTVVEIMGIQKVDDDGTAQEFVDQDLYVFSRQSDGTPKILFTSPSEEAYTARVRVALSPEVGFSTVPDWIYEYWRDTIVHGVLARLLSMRAKAWYALTESEQHKEMYLRDVRKASSKVVLETINRINRPVPRYI